MFNNIIVESRFLTYNIWSISPNRVLDWVTIFSLLSPRWLIEGYWVRPLTLTKHGKIVASQFSKKIASSSKKKGNSFCNSLSQIWHVRHQQTVRVGAQDEVAVAPPSHGITLRSYHTVWALQFINCIVTMFKFPVLIFELIKYFHSQYYVDKFSLCSSLCESRHFLSPQTLHRTQITDHILPNLSSSHSYFALSDRPAHHFDNPVC